MTYQDTNKDGLYTAGEPVIGVHEALRSGLTLAPTANPSNVVNRVSFNSIGLAPGSLGSLTLRDTAGSTRIICIAISGRPRLVPLGGACTNGIDQ
jgi:hypothetical protein